MAAIEKCLVKMGRPKNIMTDPDSSVTSVEMDEWFKRNKDVRHVLTRRHAAFAERALRDFKLIMTKMVKKEVKPWTEYINEVLERMNTKNRATRQTTTKSTHTRQLTYHPTRQPNQRTGSRCTTT